MDVKVGWISTVKNKWVSNWLNCNWKCDSDLSLSTLVKFTLISQCLYDKAKDQSSPVSQSTKEAQLYSTISTGNKGQAQSVVVKWKDMVIHSMEWHLCVGNMASTGDKNLPLKHILGRNIKMPWHSLASQVLIIFPSRNVNITPCPTPHLLIFKDVTCLYCKYFIDDKVLKVVAGLLLKQRISWQVHPQGLSKVFPEKYFF